MEEIKEVISRLEEVKRCFVKYEGEYRLHDVKLNLPSVTKKYEHILQELKIEYVYIEIERGRKLDVFCRYYDKSFYEEIDQELPAYEFRNKKYWYIGQVTAKVPTKKSVYAALKLKKKVDQKVAEARTEKCVAAIKEVMGDANAVYTKKGQFRGAPDEGPIDHYYIFVNKKEDGSEGTDIIIFDLDRIYSERVILEIPEYFVKRVLGVDNVNANRWVNTLGLSEIEIHPV